MCGRFVLMTPGRSLASRFRLTEEPTLEPRYNIAPTQVVAIVAESRQKSRRELRMVKWGLIPFWAQDARAGARLINARSESAAEKPAFRTAFKRRRCLIPADGFYHWKKTEGSKGPYFVGLANQEVFAFAGLWDWWKGPEGEIVESCTILTTDANELLRPMHERMPVILSLEDYDLWLDPEVSNPELLKPLLKPYPSDKMIVYRVGEKVNKATYEAPDCIEPLKAAV
jgi:putative SOS response-associated peptidase YedK